MARDHDGDSRTHLPVRTCVGCRGRAPKQELLRVVAHGSDDGLSVVPDPEARAPGRGAYLHPDPDCLEQASRRRAFSRALRVPGRPDESRLRDCLQLLEEK